MNTPETDVRVIAGKPTRDGTIVWQPECHCFGCMHPALGLLETDPQRDLRQRGWVRIKRRWHCAECAKERHAS